MHTIDVLGVQVFLNLAFHGRIPMVLNGIVGTAGQAFGNVGPTVAHTVLLGLEDDTILGFRPGSFRDGGVEVIMPSFSTLFADSSCGEIYNMRDV